MINYLKTKFVSENFDFEEILLIPIFATLLALLIGSVFLLATGETFSNISAVSYTHLTLPTNREV